MTESSTTMTATTTTRQECHSDIGASSQATLRAAPAQQQPEAPCLPWLPVWHHRFWHPRPSLWDDDSPKVDKDDDETPEPDWLQPDNNDDKDEEEKPHFPLDESLTTRRSHSSPPPSPKQRPDPQGKTWNEAVADSKKEEEEEEEELQASLPLSDDDDESDVSCHHDDESSGVMEEPVTPPPLVPTDAVTPDPETTTHAALWSTLLTHLLHESQHYRHQVEELQQQVKQLQQQAQPQRPQDTWNEEERTIEFVAEDTNQEDENEENDAQQDEEETEEADAWGLFEFSEPPSSNSADKSRTKLQALEQALHSTQWQVSSFQQGLQNHEAHLETRLQTVVQDLHGQMADLQVSLYQQQELQVQQLQERGRLETAMMRQIMDERVQDYETQLQHVTKQLADLQQQQQQQFSLLRQPLDSTTVPTTVHTSSSSSPSLSLAQTRTEEETTSLLALKPSLEETLTSSPTRSWQPQTVFRTKPPSTTTTTSSRTPLAEWMSRTETSPTTTPTMTTTLSLPPPALLSSPPTKRMSVPHAGRSTTATDDLLLLHNRPSFEERAERRNQLRRRRQSVESFMRAQVQHIRQRNWGDSSSSVVESMAGHQSLPTLVLQPHEQP